MVYLPHNKNLKPYSRELRNTLTDTEVILWNHLRCKQMLEVQFYRQKIIGSYIADFYAPAAKLVIEIDGAQHYEPEALEYDKVRDAYMNQLELHVMRFDNVMIRHSISEVLTIIYNFLSREATK